MHGKEKGRLSLPSLWTILEEAARWEGDLLLSNTRSDVFPRTLTDREGATRRGAASGHDDNNNPEIQYL